MDLKFHGGLSSKEDELLMLLDGDTTGESVGFEVGVGAEA